MTGPKIIFSKKYMDLERCPSSMTKGGMEKYRVNHDGGRLLQADRPPT